LASVAPPLISLDDPADPRLARFRMRDRQLAPAGTRRAAAEAVFVAEGDLVVERALAAGHVVSEVLVDASRVPPVVDALPDATPVYAANQRVRAAATRLGVPLDVIALFHRPADPTAVEVLGPATRVIAVEAVDNPSNLGTVIRSAMAFGLDALVVDGTSADPLARRSIRTSMGTVFSLPWARVERVADLAGLGFSLVALTPGPDAISIDDLRPEAGTRTALLLGSERAGLSPAALAAAGVKVRIPMAGGIDSLNVAAAAAVACYALTRPSRASRE
jgi:tRNA G18 (ribose-2'-O)-methylase SpoU